MCLQPLPQATAYASKAEEALAQTVRRAHPLFTPMVLRFLQVRNVCPCCQFTFCFNLLMHVSFTPVALWFLQVRFSCSLSACLWVAFSSCMAVCTADMRCCWYAQSSVLN